MPAPVTPGSQIDRYRIESAIGAGSMGDVFLATDLDLNRKVALKILSQRHHDNEELRARFVREARAVAAIAHPNVVQVFTTGTFDMRPYFAMEFLDGVDLGSDVQEHGTWRSLPATRALLDAARGLDAAAKAGLIHRDVKPSNLVLLKSGEVKVTDFGLAKPLDPGDEPALTALGVVVGTPDYIAPEQARGDPIDERVDIYALGGTLFYLLAGKPPFRTGRKADDKYLKVVARHLREPPPDPRASNRMVDAEVAALTQQMMAKKPVDRPDYAELLERLHGIAERLESGTDGGPIPVREEPSATGKGGSVEPTPFIGGSTPNAASLRTAADDTDDDAPTRLRMPRSSEHAVARGPAAEVPRPRVAGWLVAATVLAVLTFLVGLGLLLFGPMPSPRAASGAANAADAGPAQSTADAAVARALPVPPEGMLLAVAEDGTPLCFVDVAPTAEGDVAAALPKRKKTKASQRAKPATRVSFDDARRVARAAGKRLPTLEEWRAAAKAQGFVAAPRGAWEWVDDGADSAPTRTVVRAGDSPGTAQRKTRGGKDIAFRLARDL